jgi:hypothetical protein
MKARKMLVEQSNARLNRQAREEIRKFLQALDSYPSRVSKEPEISFEQHRDSVTENVVPSARSAANGS